MRLAATAALLLALSPALAAPPATLRVDIQHGGDANTEHFALERVLVEALPWPGNPARPIDDSNRGVNQVRVLDAETGKLLYSRGYSTVFAEWPTVVGEQIAGHAQPVALRHGVLSVAAESTAWATQLRMVQTQLLAKIAAAVGDGVVTALKITGPTAPSWRKGPRHISGRGPRDTYG